MTIYRYVGCYEKIGADGTILRFAENGEEAVALVDAAAEVVDMRPSARRAEIMQRLQEIDFATMRPLRAVQTGNHGQKDLDRLDELESQAQTLRAELKGLKWLKLNNR